MVKDVRAWTGRAAARAWGRWFTIVSCVVVAFIAARAVAEPAAEAPKGEASKGDALFDVGSFGNKKEPITITSDSLEYDYKGNVVVYHGDVLAVQGDTKVRSDKLTVTLAGANNNGGPPERATDAGAKGGQKVQEVVAVGNVRIDSGTRWATGGRAVFQQGSRTLVLTETPVLHDGPNEVAGDRVVVYLDQNRSVVEGGRKRVKAVVYPGKDGGLDANAPAKEGTPPAGGTESSGTEVAHP